MRGAPQPPYAQTGDLAVKGIARRYAYLTGTTGGLLTLAMGWEALLVAFLALLSGPFRDLGITAALPVQLLPGERVGRLVMLYHSLAMPFVAALAYFVVEFVETTPWHKRAVRQAVTAGYLAAGIGGLGFAYVTRSWLLHGLFLSGLAVMFYGGAVLTAGLWPWRHPNRDPAYAHAGKISLERTAFFVTALLTLGSALFGAAAGAYQGNGFSAFLAEDVVRESHTLLQRAVIGHLHIMLALIAVMIMLLVGRYFDFRGRLHHWAMPIAIAGTTVMSLACWSITFWPDAHLLIYVGAAFVLPAGLLLVIHGLAKTARTRDPVRFGPFSQMIVAQFVVTFPGIYTALYLDEIFRTIPLEEERLILTGHWHILSALCATIVLLLAADFLGLQGRLRKVVGWGILLGSDLAFIAAVIYEFSYALSGKRAEWAMWPVDVGIGALMLALAAFMVWRLSRLISAEGDWAAVKEDEAR